MSQKWIVGFVLGLVLMPGLCVCSEGDYFDDIPIDCGNSTWNDGSQAYLAITSIGLHALEEDKNYFLTMYQWVNVDAGYVTDYTFMGGFWYNGGWQHSYGFFQASDDTMGGIYVYLYKDDQDPGFCLTQLWWDKGTILQKDGADEMLEGVTTFADYP